MEFTSNLQERENPSPHNNGIRTSLTTTTNYNESTTTGLGNGSNGIPITRSDPNNPYPTTFVTADSSSFKQVVQMLTGSSDQQLPPKTSLIPPINKKKQGFKLYERRNYTALNKSTISTLTPSFHGLNASFSPRNKPEILSPSLLDFPSLTLSPVTPLTDDPFDKSSPAIGGGSSEVEGERVIAEKGFYFHTDPNSTPRDSEPRLLPLFPLSSPRVSNP